MRLCLDELRGCEQIFLWVLDGNEKAIRFYEQVGFRRDGTEKVLTLGTPVKGIRMVLKRDGKEGSAHE